MKISKRKETAFVIILFTASVGLALLLVEFYFRVYPFTNQFHIINSYYNKQRWIDGHTGKALNFYTAQDTFDSRYGWNPKKASIIIDGENSPHKNFIVTNLRGERAFDTLPYAKGAKKRIVFIGDSYTFGECVSNHETFAYITDSLLDNYEVINLGVHGFGMDQMYLKLINEGLKYHPDLVILGGFTEDFSRNNLWFRDYYKPFFTKEGDSLVLHQEHIEAPQTLLNKTNIETFNFLGSVYYNKVKREGTYQNIPVWNGILHNIKRACDTANVKFTILYIPNVKEFEVDETHIDVVWREFCRSENVDIINPFYAMKGAILKSKHPIEYHFECHYSPELHFAIAQTIAEHVQHTK